MKKSSAFGIGQKVRHGNILEIKLCLTAVEIVAWRLMTLSLTLAMSYQ